MLVLILTNILVKSLFTHTVSGHILSHILYSDKSYIVFIFVDKCTFGLGCIPLQNFISFMLL